MCSNGEPHRKFLPMEEVKLPTITMEVLLDNMLIDAYEDKKMANFDVSGAYLQTDLPKYKFVLLLLEGKFVDVMCDINPEYKKHVRFKYCRNTLYLCNSKAMYGMI